MLFYLYIKSLFQQATFAEHIRSRDVHRKPLSLLLHAQVLRVIAPANRKLMVLLHGFSLPLDRELQDPETLLPILAVRLTQDRLTVDWE